MENPIKMDDLGVPLFLETSFCSIIFRYLTEACPTNDTVASGLRDPLEIWGFGALVVFLGVSMAMQKLTTFDD